MEICKDTIATPKRSGHCEQTLTRILELKHRLQDASQRLATLADRLLGTMPDQEPHSKNVIGQDGAMHMIGHDLCDLSRVATSIEASVARLEDL